MENGDWQGNREEVVIEVVTVEAMSGFDNEMPSSNHIRQNTLNNMGTVQRGIGGRRCLRILLFNTIHCRSPWYDMPCVRSRRPLHAPRAPSQSTQRYTVDDDFWSGFGGMRPVQTLHWNFVATCLIIIWWNTIATSCSERSIFLDFFSSEKRGHIEELESTSWY